MPIELDYEPFYVTGVVDDERLDDVGDARRYEVRLQLNRTPDQIQAGAFLKRWEQGDAWTTRVPMRFERDHLVIENTDVEEFLKLVKPIEAVLRDANREALGVAEHDANERERARLASLSVRERVNELGAQIEWKAFSVDQG